MAWDINAAFWGPVIGAVYRAWCSTLRITVLGWETVDQAMVQGKRLAFALWHDELFPVSHLRGGLRLVTVVSQSQDGEILARALQSLGLATARGSSGRGGVKALLTAARMMRDEARHAVVTVDGPKGPRHKAKEGIFFLANKAPALVVPVRVFMSRRKVFHRAWDRFQLPLPGSRCLFLFGEPYAVAEGKLTLEILAQEQKRLERKMEALAPGIQAGGGD